MARCMLYSKGKHNKFWVEAICFTNFILNRVPTKDFKHVTPKEKWNACKPNIIILRCLVVNFGLIFLMKNEKN